MLTHPEEQRQKADASEFAARLDKGQLGWEGLPGGHHASQSQGFLPVYREGLRGSILLEAALGHL